MKRIFLFMIVSFLLVSCSGDLTVLEKELIIGERIDGPANIRDTINGEVIFELFDNAFVDCTPLKNDWFVVGVYPTNKAEDYNKEGSFIKKGKDLIVNGEVIGKAIKDVEVTMGIQGYTHKNNIKKETIIENALLDCINSNNGSRSLKVFENFIYKFELERDEQFENVVVFYCYENSIEDPSPMMRIGLVFQENKLISILHSRNIVIKETSDNKLDYAFNCLTFNDIKNKEEIVKMFNHFVNSVD